MSPDSRVKISPSILAAAFACLGDEVTAICEAGCDYVHVVIQCLHICPECPECPDVKSVCHDFFILFSAVCYDFVYAIVLF